MIPSVFIGLYLFVVCKTHGDEVGLGQSLWRSSISTPDADINMPPEIHTQIKHYNAIGVPDVARGGSTTGRLVRGLTNGWTLGASSGTVSGLTGSTGNHFIKPSDDFDLPYDDSRDVWRNSAVDDYRFAQTPLHTDNTERGFINTPMLDMTGAWENNRANERPSSIGETSDQYSWNLHFPEADVSAPWGDNSMIGSLQAPVTVFSNIVQRIRDMSNIPTKAGFGTWYKSQNEQVDNFPRVSNNGVSEWQRGKGTRVYGSKVFDSGHTGGGMGAWEGENRVSGSVSSGRSPVYWGGAANDLARAPFMQKSTRSDRGSTVAGAFGARLTGGTVARGYRTRSTLNPIAGEFGDRSTEVIMPEFGNRRRFSSGNRRAY